MVTKLEKCRICLSEDLKEFLSLGDQPPANRFLKPVELSTPEARIPLNLCWCARCHLVQLTHVVDPEDLFRNYIYFSSGMPKLSDHFKSYAEDVMQRYLLKGDFVVEIASNDGILLNFFKEHGFRILGIDPATNVALVAQGIGVPTICDFFSEEMARRLVRTHGKARAILANNVVAHIHDHHDLARGIATLLDDTGIFILEAPYLIDMFENLTYDTIYHEHLSYLAIRPLKRLFEQYGLEIVDVELHPVQGQSLRVFVARQGAHRTSENVGIFLKREETMALHRLDSYDKLTSRIQASKDKLITLLSKIRSSGMKIAAYGAPAKGNTLLNYAGIGTEILEFALEDLPSKQGLYTPGMHIPVVDRRYAEDHLPDYYLLLAWNYRGPIFSKEAEYRKRGGKFIIPIGDEIQIQ